MPPFSTSHRCHTTCPSRRAVIIKRFSHLYYIVKGMGRRRAGGHSARPERAASEQKEQKKEKPQKGELKLWQINWQGKHNQTRCQGRTRRRTRAPKRGESTRLSVGWSGCCCPVETAVQDLLCVRGNSLPWAVSAAFCCAAFAAVAAAAAVFPCSLFLCSFFSP